MSDWSAEQILALAPDPSAAAAGRSLASARKWETVGCDARAAWGECRGSGAKPYQVQIDLAQPAFKCSCPSRKFPCKHCLGLFLLWADHAVGAAEPPAWVQEWLSKRTATAENKEKRTAAKVAAPADETGRDKRAAQREARVAAGIEECDLWLRDLVRSGLAVAQTQPNSFWERMAARMVDAQAPGIARRIREMAGVPASGAGWASRLLEEIGRLALLIEAYRNIESQTEAMQATIRTHIGWTVKQEDLALQEGRRAEWLVVGRSVEPEERLLAQRTWLLSRSGSALLLHFAAYGQPFDLTFLPGGCLDAELVFYPGALAQRAVVKSLFGEAPTLGGVPCYRNVAAYLDAYSEALAADPWLERHLAPLGKVIPHVAPGGGFAVRDDDGRMLPIQPGFQKPWQLVSLAGGRPITVFGEWDGYALLPLSAVAEGRVHDLSATRGA